MFSGWTAGFGPRPARARRRQCQGWPWPSPAAALLCCCLCLTFCFCQASTVQGEQSDSLLHRDGLPLARSRGLLQADTVDGNTGTGDTLTELEQQLVQELVEELSQDAGLRAALEKVFAAFNPQSPGKQSVDTEQCVVELGYPATIQSRAAPETGRIRCGREEGSGCSIQQCCSEAGWCGAGAAACGPGCQLGYGACAELEAWNEPAVTTTPAFFLHLQPQLLAGGGGGLSTRGGRRLEQQRRQEEVEDDGRAGSSARAGPTCVAYDRERGEVQAVSDGEVCGNASSILRGLWRRPPPHIPQYWAKIASAQRPGECLAAALPRNCTLTPVVLEPCDSRSVRSTWFYDVYNRMVLEGCPRLCLAPGGPGAEPQLVMAPCSVNPYDNVVAAVPSNRAAADVAEADAVRSPDGNGGSSSSRTIAAVLGPVLGIGLITGVVIVGLIRRHEARLRRKQHMQILEAEKKLEDLLHGLQPLNPTVEPAVRPPDLVVLHDASSGGALGPQRLAELVGDEKRGEEEEALVPDDEDLDDKGGPEGDDEEPPGLAPGKAFEGRSSRRSSRRLTAGAESVTRSRKRSSASGTERSSTSASEAAAASGTVTGSATTGHMAPTDAGTRGQVDTMSDSARMRWLTALGRVLPPRPEVNLEVDPTQDIEYTRHLGRGSFGIVYEGWWTDRQDVKRRVAVKFMDGKLLVGQDRERHLRYFRNEMDIMTRIKHPYIITCYGGCIRDNCVCIVLEFAAGGTLDNYIHMASSTRVTDREILSICQSVSSALAYLHPHVVHCDIKPQNVLLTPEGVIKVSDFGLSKYQQGSALSSLVGGTPAYCAPEVLRMEAVTEKCDIYSLGMMLWEACTGKIPFSNLDNRWQIHHLVQNMGYRPPLPDDRPRSITQLIRGCWAQDARQRPSAMVIFRRAEFAMAELGPYSAHNSGLSSRTTSGIPETAAAPPAKKVAAEAAAPPPAAGGLAAAPRADAEML